jgi:hypothetical protein
MSSGSFAINSSKRILSIENLKLLYYSLVHSHLNYGTILWGAAYRYRLHKLEIIQKRCIRNVCNASYNAHSDPLFKRLAIPKLIDVNKIQLCKFMFCYIHEQLPTPLLTIFATNVEIHNYKTRRQFDPHVQMRHSSNIAKTFIHQSPKLWLELPIVIKSSNTAKSFSNRLTKYLISQY